MERPGYSVLAIAAGILVVVLPTLITDAAIQSLRSTSQSVTLGDGFFIFATLYRTIYSVIGSFITARFAPNQPLRHALVGGTLGLGASIGGVIASWNAGPELGPKWYPYALVVIALPCAWAGAKLEILFRKKQTLGRV